MFLLAISSVCTYVISWLLLLSISIIIVCMFFLVLLIKVDLICSVVHITALVVISISLVDLTLTNMFFCLAVTNYQCCSFSSGIQRVVFCYARVKCHERKNWIDCPACYGSQHSCHVDGNAKLYRYSCVPR